MADRKPPPIPAKPMRHTIQMTPFDPANPPPGAAQSAPVPPPKIDVVPPPPPERQLSDSMVLRDRTENRPLPPPPPEEVVSSSPPIAKVPRPPASPALATSPAPALGDDLPKRTPHPPREPPRNASPSPGSLEEPPRRRCRPHPPKTPPPPSVAVVSTDDPTRSPMPASIDDEHTPTKRVPHPPRELPPGGSAIRPHPPKDPPLSAVTATAVAAPRTHTSSGRSASPGRAEDGKHHDKEKRRSLTPEVDTSRLRAGSHVQVSTSTGSAYHEKRNSGHRRSASVQAPSSSPHTPKDDTSPLTSAKSLSKDRVGMSSSSGGSSSSRDHRDRWPDRDREHRSEHSRRDDSHGSHSRSREHSSHDKESAKDRERRDEKDREHRERRGHGDSNRRDEHSKRDERDKKTGGDLPRKERSDDSRDRERKKDDNNSPKEKQAAHHDTKDAGSIIASQKKDDNTSPKQELKDSKERETTRKEDSQKRLVRKHVRSQSTDMAAALLAMSEPLPPAKSKPHPPAKPPPLLQVLGASQSAVQLSTTSSPMSSSSSLPNSSPLSSSPSTPSPMDEARAVKKPPPVPSRPERVLRPQQGGSLIARPTPAANSDGQASPAPLNLALVQAADATKPAAPGSGRRRLSLEGTRSSNRTTEEQVKGTGPAPPEFAAQLLTILKDIKPKELPAGKPADDIEAWPTQPRAFKKWSHFDAVSDMLVINWNEYAVELGDPTLLAYPTLTFEDEERCTAYYESALAKATHSHWIARNEEHGPVVVSIEKVKERRMRVLLRAKKQDERILLPPNSKKKMALVLDVFPMYAQLKFRKVPGEKLQEKLIQFERKTLESMRYKFGVLYCKAGQKEENQWYANQEKDQSQAFSDFLNVIGDRIKMRAWDKFCGGLDNKYGTTGESSVYAAFKGCEVMYHVSTLLPFYPDDVQQVERKRHLGNDVCLIVFRDKGCVPFDPMIIKSQFNHIFAVVEQAEGGKYRVQFAYKIGVNYFGPSFPAAPVLAGIAFREFLITKLVNGQRAAMYAPDFRGKTTRTRRTLLQDVVPQDDAPAPQVVPAVVSGGVEAVGNLFRRTLFLGKGNQANAAASPTAGQPAEV